MTTSAITFGPGITLSAGITIGNGASTGSSGVVTYQEMAPPIIPRNQLEDGTAVVNGSIGFTIYDSSKTGVAITAPTSMNRAFFANYETGQHTVTWGAGSTYASNTINLVQTNESLIVFYIIGVNAPATFNFPFTFN